MYKVVFIRHGESEWNLQNKFTGWADADLTPNGIQQAIQAGQFLLKAGFVFDIAFTSLLKRAIKTLHHVLDEMNLLWIPETKTWHLNERHYGALQGLNKTGTSQQFSAEQVLIWRRSYATAPPPLEETDERNPAFDLRYKAIDKKLLPLTESLESMLHNRVLPYWQECVMPQIAEGKNIIIAAHGNTLRGIVKYLGNMSDEAIEHFEIPTGVPLVYEFNDQMKPLQHYYSTSTYFDHTPPHMNDRLNP